jgi:ABC-type lipoprotein release transport system permease subunit
LPSFLLESDFVAIARAALGVVLGLLLARQVEAFVTRTNPGMRLIVPWARIVGIVELAYLASLLTTYLLARRAARVAPGEARRDE